MQTYHARSDVRSLDMPERQVVMWQEDGIFTKNPDIVLLPSGKLLCVFNATDFHWPTEFSSITLIESTDRGRTWGRPRIIHTAYPGRGEERWVTPRLSRLRDGRLVILCDQNDYRHCHEDQPPGIYSWWSEDEGESWAGPQATDVPGIEPDRVVELADGTLLVGTHFMRGATQKLAEAVLRSHDGGQSWGEMVIVASDGVHEYCEGGLLALRSGRLVCIMRENNHINYPSYLAFSEDRGRTWSKPVEAPFSGDRPYAQQLADGRTLVTFRNQAGKPGLYAWLGDIEAEAGYKVARAGLGTSHRTIMNAGEVLGAATVRAEGGVRLEADCLVIEASAEQATRYMLLPPEGFTSTVFFEAEIAVAGQAGHAAGTIQIAHLGLYVTLYPNKVAITGAATSSGYKEIDLTQRRQLKITTRRGLTEIRIDGKVILARLVHRSTIWDRSFFGSSPEQEGQVSWYSVRYGHENPTEPAHEWAWAASSGEYPNQYEIERWLELDYNSNPKPDHGYSSWIQFPDGEIFVADYSNEGCAPGRSRLKGYYLKTEDFDSQQG